MPRGDSPASLEALQRGRSQPCSDERRARIAASQSGSLAHHWAGDAVGYGGAHKRHRALLPRRCESCGSTQGRLDAALRHETPLERLRGCVRRKRIFSTATADYIRLCRSCHLRYDRNT